MLVQEATGLAVLIRNAAFAQQQRLHDPYTVPASQPGTADTSRTAAVSYDTLPGIPTQDIQQAKQAWQRLVLERLEYLR